MMIGKNRIIEWHKLCQRVWSIHFILVGIVIGFGMMLNRGLKLIPSSDATLGGNDCDRTFINVLAPSVNETNALVCCSSAPSSDIFLCSNFKSHLFLYKRLTRFPDAWIIPLVPIILRGIWLVWHMLLGNNLTAAAVETWATYLKRFNVYMTLLFLRGFVLYMGFNWIEQELLQQPSDDECWYADYTRRRKCQGLTFDFSDHTLLFLGQLLPIPLVEVLYSWLVPSLSSSWLSTTRIFTSIILFYLYGIVLLGQYQTTRYFHTRTEILVGFLVSFSIQCPLAYLQCSMKWERVRANLFGLPKLDGSNRLD